MKAQLYMQTTYIRFCQQYNDPVLGPQALPWISTALVRVTRNRLRKAHFEWVGNAAMPFNLDEVRKAYPIAMYNVEFSGGAPLYGEASLSNDVLGREEQ